MNPTLTNPLQSLGTGDTTALAVEEFSGLVLAALPTKTKIWPHGMKHQLTQGNSYTFEAVGKMSVQHHTPGTERAGTGQPPIEERTIPIDNEEITADAWIGRTQQDMAHFDITPRCADEAAKAIGKRLDQLAARHIAIGARQDERDCADGQSLPSGNLVRRNAATVAAGYPVSKTGSSHVQDDLAQMGQLFREADIDDSVPWIAFVPPYLQRVLLQDRSLTAKEYQDPITNNRLFGNMELVENFRLIPTNNMPNAITYSATEAETATAKYEKESAYHGDFTNTSILCLAGEMAFGSVLFREIEPTGPTWHELRRAFFIGAASYQGTKWIRPEYCGEIYCDTDAYAVSDGVYLPV